MKNKNICKFINDNVSGKLQTRNFVFESAPQTDRDTRLSYNMAILAVSGNGIFSFSSVSFPIEIGTLIFGFSGDTLTVKNAKELTYIYISFEGVRAEELFKRFGITKDNRSFSGFEGIISFWQGCISGIDDGGADLAAESALLYAFSRLSGIISQADDAVAKAIAIAEEDFSDSELSLSSVSDRLGYNSKYLSHAFKKKMGVGFSQYLKTVRINHAVFLMEHGVSSVKNIAYLCGFSDPLYFSSVFKQTVGCSPKEMIRKGNERS